MSADRFLPYTWTARPLNTPALIRLGLEERRRERHELLVQKAIAKLEERGNG